MDQNKQSAEDDDITVITTAVTALATAITVVEHSLIIPREPHVNMDTMRTHFLRRLYMSNDKYCHNMLRMNRNAFRRLCERLVEKGICNGRSVTVEEKVAMFLFMIGHHVKNRVAQFCFMRSGETISRHFNNVLRAVIKLYRDLVKPSSSRASPFMSDYSRSWYSYFEDAVGALDGSHVPVIVPLADQPRYRNRKGNITQNILAVCSFDMKFTYVFAGWEGSAHDARILRSAVYSTTDPLTVPTGKYYLADAGYGNSPGYLTPFRGVQYHLKEHDKHIPRNAKELYNFRHSSLRNVIERTFGVWKKRFKFLTDATSFDIDTQVNLVLACCVIHNHIVEVDPTDLCEDEPDIEEEETEDSLEEQSVLQATPEWTAKRELIANLMWEEYDHRHP